MSFKQILVIGYIITLSQLLGCRSDDRIIQQATKLESSQLVSAKMLVQQGAQKDNQGNYTEALNDLNKAISLNNKSAEGYFNRGLVYYHLNKVEKAIEDFTTAIVLDHKFIKAYVNRGNIYLELQEYSKSIKDYQKVLSFNPNNSLALNNLGLVYLNLGNYEEAAKYFKSAIANSPDYPDAYFNQGVLLLEAKRDQDAILNFSKAMNLAKAQNNSAVYQAAQLELKKLGVDSQWTIQVK